MKAGVRKEDLDLLYGLDIFNSLPSSTRSILQGNHSTGKQVTNVASEDLRWGE